jgi:hypothetical protein
MIKIITIVFITILAAKSCGKVESEEMVSGIITKSDLRECACCGGWFIEIGSETYRFYELPEKSEMKISAEKLPMEVKLRWEKEENPCWGDEIKILSIKKR